MRTRLELLAASLFLIFATAIFFAYRVQQRDTATLRTELQTAKSALDQVAAKEKSRDAQTQQTLAKLQHQKLATKTPAQIVQALPSVLPLPTPLSTTFNTAPPTNPGREVAPNSNSPTQAQTTTAIDNKPSTKKSAPADSLPIQIPPEDLKPLYDFAVDCKTCAVRLAAAQADLKDEQAKSATLTKERDTAVKAAKGGSFLRRIARASKWFVLGALAGAAAARLAH